jgi:GTP-binding protein EngB required for normal cell division
MDIKQINQAIMFGNLTNTELTSVIDAVKWKRATIAKLTKASLMLGDTVTFTSTKTGRTMQGTVTKIAIKYVTVSVPGWGSWKVPANMLSKIEDTEFA